MNCFFRDCLYFSCLSVFFRPIRFFRASLFSRDYPFFHTCLFFRDVPFFRTSLFFYHGLSLTAALNASCPVSYQKAVYPPKKKQKNHLDRLSPELDRKKTER